MAIGSVGLAAVAVILLGHSGAGVVIFAEAPAGTAIAIPANAVAYPPGRADSLDGASTRPDPRPTSCLDGIRPSREEKP